MIRPQLDKLENCMDFVKETIRLCWSESPDKRLDFKCIRSRLRPLRRGIKANIFDNMITMMETYANNLETLVDERTQMLINEKRKTEELLYEMMPKVESCQRTFENFSQYLRKTPFNLGSFPC